MEDACNCSVSVESAGNERVKPCESRSALPAGDRSAESVKRVKEVLTEDMRDDVLVVRRQCGIELRRLGDGHAQAGENGDRKGSELTEETHVRAEGV